MTRVTPKRQAPLIPILRRFVRNDPAYGILVEALTDESKKECRAEANAAISCHRSERQGGISGLAIKAGYGT